VCIFAQYIPNQVRNTAYKHLFLFFLSYCCLPLQSFSQTGISVSPPRTYFTSAPGQTQTKTILVSNPSKTSALDISVAINDWEYDKQGNNIIHEGGKLKTSLASWISVLPQSFFSLAPGASHEIAIQLKTPVSATDSVPVHTAMVYITQLNPTPGVDEKGANIKVAVRSGVKIYHRYDVNRKPDVDITGFSYKKSDNKKLNFTFRNTGNLWVDGTLTCDLLNQQTGEKIKLKDVVFYSMPGDDRDVEFGLPDKLPVGKYIATAIVNFDDSSAVKVAELTFNYEGPATLPPTKK
jgi:hypothetical protein